MSWINDLDACASAGVISFDAPAYIKGVPPRYVGNPDITYLPDYLPAAPKPAKDEFTRSTDPHNNPTWKKVLLGAILAGTGIAAVIGGKKLFKNPKLGKRIKVHSKLALRWIKNIPTKIKNTQIMTKLKNVFRRTPRP